MERLIVFALVFLLPTQLAYHLWPQFSYIYGLRVDYLSPTIYLTGVLIVLLIPYLLKRIIFKKKFFVFLISIIVFAFLNIIFAESQIIALLKWIVVFNFILLGSYFYLCDLYKLKKTITSALSLSLVVFTTIGFIQFFLQKTIGGPLYYLGERDFTALTPGIALINFFGKSFMKAYSTFPHPNSFAGFVVVSFLILLSFYSKKMKVFFRKLFPIFIVVVLSLLLTLSLNAIIGVSLITILFLTMKNFPKIVEKTKIFLPVMLIGLSFLFGTVSSTVSKNINTKETYKERIVLADKAIEVFSSKPILGVGLNNFFLVTKSTQPPHNIYLIILCETGIVGAVILFILLSRLLSLKLNRFLFLAIVFVLLTSLFDHYWFTLWQNQLLLSFLLGLSARKEYSNNLHGK